MQLARRRARENNILFDLTADEVSVPEFCPVLGIRLMRNRGGKHQWDASPTLDRIDPRLGYTASNVLVVSWKVNRMKAGRSPAEIATLFDFYKRFV